MTDYPDEPGPGRSVAGRHVLGSSPESLEPVRSASLPSLSPVSDPRPEPGHTIYLPEWFHARWRLQRLPSFKRDLFTRALDHVESGWEHVRELQRHADANREHTLANCDTYSDLLDFIDGDLVDIFRVIAAEVSRLVPGYPEWEERASADEVDGDTDVFRRYFTVFALAVEQEPKAEPLREATRAAKTGLAGWCTEMGILVASIAAVCKL